MVVGLRFMPRCLAFVALCDEESTAIVAVMAHAIPRSSHLFGDKIASVANVEIPASEVLRGPTLKALELRPPSILCEL